MISHCDFNFNFPNWDVKNILPLNLLVICTFFLRGVYSNLWSTFIRFLLALYQLVRVFIHFRYTYFLPLGGLPFYFASGVFQRVKVFNLGKVQWNFFFFHLWLMFLLCFQRILCLHQGHKYFSPVFPLVNVTILFFTFRSIIYFLLVFWYIIKEGSIFVFPHTFIQLPSNNFLKTFLFPLCGSGAFVENQFYIYV